MRDAQRTKLQRMGVSELGDMINDGEQLSDEGSAESNEIHECGNCGLHLLGKVEKCPECGHLLRERLTLIRFDLGILLLFVLVLGLVAIFA